MLELCVSAKDASQIFVLHTQVVEEIGRNENPQSLRSNVQLPSFEGLRLE